MLCATGQSVTIDHIAYQVINECKNYCQNCYLRDKDTDPSVIEELTELIESGKLFCWDFTISLNSIIHSVVPRFQVYNLIRVLRNSHIDVNITVHDIDDLLYWIPPSALSMVRGVSMSRISDRCIKRLLHWNKKLRIRQAVIARGTVNHLQKLPQNAQRFLILEKQPLGDKALWFSTKAYQHTTEKLEDFLPDTCVSEIKEHGTCRAGSGRIHIWPDGSVTACPYDSKRRNPVEGSLLERITEAINIPFQKCDLPEELCNL